jgi:hypothetical protein
VFSSRVLERVSRDEAHERNCGRSISHLIEITFQWNAGRESRKFRFGSPNVNEIELSRYLTDEWPNVLNWLKKLALLKSGELERLVSRV